MIPALEWERLERGLLQRVWALNLFLRGIYHDQEILNGGRVPRVLVEGNPSFRPQMLGIALPHGAYTRVVGCELIRDARGHYRVLERLREPFRALTH